MEKNLVKPLIVYIFCIIITFVCGAFAVQNDNLLKEVLGLAAIITAIFSILPLFLILAQLRFFENLALPLKPKPKQLSLSSRNAAVLTAILFSGAAFSFFYLLGCGLLPLPENVFRITSGKGFIMWLGFLMLIALFSLRRWYLKGAGRKAGWNFSDLGLDGQTEKDIKIIRPAFRAKRIIPHAIVMAIFLVCSFFILLFIFNAVYRIEFQYIQLLSMPFDFSRLGRCFIYFPVFTAFFTINAGVKLYGQHRLPEIKLNKKKSGALTQLNWWLYSMLVMLGGLVFIILIKHILFYVGKEPGADMLYSPLFAVPFMQVMLQLVPLFAVFFFISTWLYRKSGTIYTGSFVLAILATWVFTGGSAVF